MEDVNMRDRAAFLAGVTYALRNQIGPLGIPFSRLREAALRGHYDAHILKTIDTEQELDEAG